MPIEVAEIASDRDSNLPTIIEPKGWEDYVRDITHHWGKAVDSIIETGRILVEAKEGPYRLKHGAFEAMVRTKLPFNERTAQMLMKIARHPVLSNPKHVSLLPPSWGTLYELSKLPDDKLLTGIRDGIVNPKLERKDVKALTREKPSRNASTNKPNLRQENAQLKAEVKRLRDDKGDVFDPNDTIVNIARVLAEKMRRLSNDKAEKVLAETKKQIKLQRALS